MHVEGKDLRGAAPGFDCECEALCPRLVMFSRRTHSQSPSEMFEPPAIHMKRETRREAWGVF